MELVRPGVLSFKVELERKLGLPKTLWEEVKGFILEYMG